MYGYEQKCKAIDTYFLFDCSIADTVAELGYPNRHTLYLRVQDYKKHGEVRRRRQARDPRYTGEKKRSAVGHHPSHGKSPARTMRAMGYPGSREYLCAWIDKYAPGQRKLRRPDPSQEPPSLERKIEIVAALEARSEAAAEVADGYGASGSAPYRWRRQPHSGDNASEANACAGGGGREREMRRAAQRCRRARAYGREPPGAGEEAAAGARRAPGDPGAGKKDPGTDPNRLTNREKARLTNSLGGDGSSASRCRPSTRQRAAMSAHRPR